MFSPPKPIVVGTIPGPPSIFTPVFQRTVQAWGYGIGMGAPVNPTYCLSEKSAVELAKLLADLQPSIIHMLPFGPLFHGQITGMENPDGVPWFAFPDGSYLNAGSDLAAFWTHGYGDGPAMRNARGIIALNQRDFAAGV